VDTISRFNVDHVTITINMVDPEVGARIYPWVYFNHKRYKGVEAARLLSERQLRGLEMLTERGILCKVNSVMIPGVNDDHLVEVNRAVKSRGAFLHNIMPLISEPEHGTYFGLNGQRGPTAQELKKLQDRCAGEMNMMRHCRQCRADAVGLLGEDRSAEFSTAALAGKAVSYDAEARQAYQAVVEQERAARRSAREEAIRETMGSSAEAAGDLAILLAVATKGGGRINQHFGHAKEFQVYEVSASGAKFVGHRRVDLYCQGGYGEEEALDGVIKAIADCAAVLVAKIGHCPQEQLQQAGIEAVTAHAFDYIETAALKYFQTYVERLAAGEVVQGAGRDALIRQGAYMAS
jgi:nitrogen fixation protein NifB